MNLADYSRLDGVALAELVRKRKVTAKELALSFVEAVGKVNPRINAVMRKQAVLGDPEQIGKAIKLVGQRKQIQQNDTADESGQEAAH